MKEYSNFAVDTKLLLQHSSREVILKADVKHWTGMAVQDDARQTLLQAGQRSRNVENLACRKVFLKKSRLAISSSIRIVDWLFVALFFFVCMLIGVVGPAHAQVCPAGQFNPLSPFNGTAPSQTIVNGNTILVGGSRVQLSHVTNGSATISTNQISDAHIAGEVGVRMGHPGTANSPTNYIESIYSFQNPLNTLLSKPVNGLRFSLHDIDAADVVTVTAYDQSNTAIALSPAIYTLDTSAGANVVTYVGANTFRSSNADVGDRRGTIHFNYSGFNVSRVVLRYHDTSAGGTFTLANLVGCNRAITLRKITSGGVGGPFNFALSNTTQVTGSVSTVSVSVPVQVDGNTGVAGIQAFTVSSPTTAVTINESGIPAGWSLTGATCIDDSSATIGSLSGSTYTISGTQISSSISFTCNFTNTKLPIVRLQKALPSGRFVATDQFALTIAGTGGPVTVTTTGAGTTATGVATLNPGAVGAVYTLSEAASGGTVLTNYLTTWACTNALGGGQTPSGSGTSFTVTAVAGDDLTCTFTNTRNAQADLRLTKTNTTGVNGEVDQVADTVVSGTPTTYTITVSNLGPNAANGAIITDPAPTNLTCSTATCAASGGAACPVPTGAALVSALQGAGATVPTLPNGGSVAITLNCTVN